MGTTLNVGYQYSHIKVFKQTCPFHISFVIFFPGVVHCRDENTILWHVDIYQLSVLNKKRLVFT